VTNALRLGLRTSWIGYIFCISDDFERVRKKLTEATTNDDTNLDTVTSSGDEDGNPARKRRRTNPPKRFLDSDEDLPIGDMDDGEDDYSTTATTKTKQAQAINSALLQPVNLGDISTAELPAPPTSARNSLQSFRFRGPSASKSKKSFDKLKPSYLT